MVDVNNGFWGIDLKEEFIAIIAIVFATPLILWFWILSLCGKD